MTQDFAVPSVTDELPIAIRAYACPVWEANSSAKGKSKSGHRSKPPASDWTLIFDTETTTDAGQSLRFGTYQWRNAGELDEAGIFFDPEGVSNDELTLLEEYADREGLVLRTRQDFVDEVFFARAWRFRATIIGFNLPFDISRLAIRHGSARAPKDAEAAAMRGGFTFTLSEQKIYPNIRIKHMSSRAALISFAAPMGQRNSRGERKRKIKTRIRRGHFIDIKTLAAALFARNFSLSSLSKFLAVSHSKLEFDAFDGPISEEMVRYAVRDVQTTWECYAALIEGFGELNLSQSIPERIYSEAGIGKAYLKEMGIQPWRKVQPDVPRSLIGTIMGSYYGGRSEVRIRREISQVMLCDFLSMYPTVCTLMGLWHFVIAQGMTWRDTTEETRALLDSADLETLRSREFWAGLSVLVRVTPDADIFPVRASYSGEAQSTIGANYLTSDTPLWFTLADCIASKLLTGKAPKVLEAIGFKPGPIQPDLQPIDIAGNPEYRVDPNTTDFFKRTIELRQTIKRQMKDSEGEERERFDTEQNALKICANSTSYGIWVEINVDARPEPKELTIVSSATEPFTFHTYKVENPGSYFHPLLAALITGAARLMLALAERLASDQGLGWAFCDTDSMAFAKPDDMDNEDFTARVRRIVDWFAPLNPYKFKGSILKIEDVNTSLDGNEQEPLYCFAISAKRYCLFNLASDGLPVMRKVSAHGLGHLRLVYEGEDAPIDFPVPDSSVLRDGTARWHCDFWHRIVIAAQEGHPDQMARDYHPALSKPAISRYAATSPDMLRWFKTYNKGRPYREQVKPFGFLLSMTPAWDVDSETIIAAPRKGRPEKAHAIKPVAPFDSDHGKAVAFAFDRETGKSVAVSSLRTYGDALAQYHISPEAKFLNGDFLDHGITQRRHVHVSGIIHIGKEAHDWERQAVLGLMEDSEISYGVASDDLAGKLQAFLAEFGEVQAAKALRIAKRQLTALLSGRDSQVQRKLIRIVTERLPDAVASCTKLRSEWQQEITELKAAIERDGLRVTARRLGVNSSNLRRKFQKSILTVRKVDH